MLFPIKEKIIHLVKSYDIEKPTRYLGAEINSVIKTDSKFKFALSFPDLYEIGITNLGISILYEAVNNIEFASCERVYAVGRDFENILREKNIALYTLETFTPLNKVDLLGFSLQYELLYTNILQILDLGQIPIKREDRSSDMPIVMAGGPSVYNTSPLEDFIDLFFIGEADTEITNIVKTIYEMKQNNIDREEIIKHLASFEYIYSPKYPKEKTKRIFVENINETPYAKKLIIPILEGIQNRISIEISRGCTHSCRFCLAGITYRPVRNRSAKKIIEIVKENLKNTGATAINLTSLSADDYPVIKPLISYLQTMGENEGFSLSLPSLRIDSFDLSTAERISEFKKTGLTFALEVGSAELRKKINKSMDEDAIYKIITDLKGLGWKTIKIYFMMGFTDDPNAEIDNMIETLKKISSVAGRGVKINAAVNVFIPKAHTPLERANQLKDDEAIELISRLKSSFRGTNIFIKFHSPRMAEIEGLFSRGDKKIGAVIYLAYKKGARLDAWHEHFNYALWTEALEELNINIDDYLKFNIDPLPWKHIDTNINDNFLNKEKEKFDEGVFTDDCATSSCKSCGIDHSKYCKKDVEDNFVIPKIEKRKKENIYTTTDKLFVHYQKHSIASLLGMHDIKRLIVSALKISGVNITLSQGFHPLPKIIFNEPTPFGCESDIEYFEVSTIDNTDANSIKEKLNELLSQIGINIISVEKIPTTIKKIQALPKNIVYRLYTTDDGKSKDILLDKMKLREVMERKGEYAVIQDNESLVVTLFKCDKAVRVRDIKDYLLKFTLNIVLIKKIALID